MTFFYLLEEGLESDLCRIADLVPRLGGVCVLFHLLDGSLHSNHNNNRVEARQSLSPGSSSMRPTAPRCVVPGLYYLPQDHRLVAIESHDDLPSPLRVSLVLRGLPCPVGLGDTKVKLSCIRWFVFYPLWPGLILFPASPPVGLCVTVPRTGLGLKLRLLLTEG